MNQALKTKLSGNKRKKAAWEKAKKAGTHILKKGIPAIVKVGTSGVIDADKIIEDESSKLMEKFSKDLIEEYSKNKDVIASFKENVSKVLEEKKGDITKLYIFVDELDRCRPTYAIELLESIKHLLDIEGLVFILSLDKQQLAHSVKGVYGAEFDAIGYLRRFIDIEYSLKEGELDEFIEQLYETFEFKRFFDARAKYQAFQYDPNYLKNVFKLLAKSKKLSLREVEQLFSRLNLVILSTEENTYIYPALLAFLLVVKEYHATVYENYIKENNDPKDIIKLLYSMLTEEERFESFECALIEGFLIAAKRDRYEDYASDALITHEEVVKDENTSYEAKSYSEKVIRVAMRPVSDLDGSVNLSSIVERIEMSEQFKFDGEES